MIGGVLRGRGGFSIDAGGSSFSADVSIDAGGSSFSVGVSIDAGGSSVSVGVSIDAGGSSVSVVAGGVRVDGGLGDVHRRVILVRTFPWILSYFEVFQAGLYRQRKFTLLLTYKRCDIILTILISFLLGSARLQAVD